MYFMKPMFGIGKMLPLFDCDSKMLCNFPKDFMEIPLVESFQQKIAVQRSSTQRKNYEK